MTSVRGKRTSKIDELPAKKSKRRRWSGSDDDDEDRGPWVLRPTADFPTSSIYNCTSRSQPAELFRKDLISAMKLPDSEPLTADDYWLIGDSWKQEWEKGVQVPVNPEAIPYPSVRVWRKKDKTKGYKLPNNYIRITHDEFFSNNLHHMSNAPVQAEKMCRYDLDLCDAHWLKAFNEERAALDDTNPVEELTMELVIEELEVQCHENMQHAIQTEDGLGIEYDEDVICDVCRSPDSEEGNEMVFCDACNICVHQACYGIMTIPAGSWLCCTCTLGIKPACLLCPNKGGAMKSTRSGQKWAHVSCALWIPEVIIGCVEKMEPITQISQVPPSRWALVCCVCRERHGACIQCSVKSCKTAYHVTCGFQKGLEMKTIMEDATDDESVKFRSYCPKHSKRRNNDFDSSDSDDALETPVKKRNKPKISPKKEISLEEKANARALRLTQIESEFFNYVSLKKLVDNLKVDKEVADFIFNYWKLKRSAAFNQPLLPPSVEDIDALGREHDDSLNSRMKMFVHLRQDLERVRNLCYMVNRREKLSRTLCEMREEIFNKQVSLLTNRNPAPGSAERNKVIHIAHSTNIYDRLCASELNCCEHSTVRPKESPKGHNGIVRSSVKIVTDVKKLPNPYAKTYFNGRSQRRSVLSNESDVIVNRSTDLREDITESTSDSQKENKGQCNEMVDRHDSFSLDSVALKNVETKSTEASHVTTRTHATSSHHLSAESTTEKSVSSVGMLKVSSKSESTKGRDEDRFCRTNQSSNKVVDEESNSAFRGKENTCHEKNTSPLEPLSRKSKNTPNSVMVSPFSSKSGSNSDSKRGMVDPNATKRSSRILVGKKESPDCKTTSSSKATMNDVGNNSNDPEPSTENCKKLRSDTMAERVELTRKQNAKECESFRNLRPCGTLNNHVAKTDEGEKMKTRLRKENVFDKKTSRVRYSSESSYEDADGMASSVDEMSPKPKSKRKTEVPGRTKEADNKSKDELIKRKSCRLKGDSVKIANTRYASMKPQHNDEDCKNFKTKYDGHKHPRQESSCVRKNLAQNSYLKSHLSVTSLLGGYRIPKKTRRDVPATDSEASPSNAAGEEKKSEEKWSPPDGWRRDTNRNLLHTPDKPGTPSPQTSPRLVLKLRKDPNFPESSRWQRDVEGDTAPVSENPSDHREPNHARCKLPLTKSTWPQISSQRTTATSRMNQPFHAYGMRSRTVVQDLYGKFSGSEPS